MAAIIPVNLSIPLNSAAPAAASAAPATGAGSAFQSIFQDAVSQVETFGQQATGSINRFLSGEGEELHQVALKTQEADLSFQLFLQARNKIISAYQEVMRMQV
ncbi:MAG: flagellar hook-basal body complex protein FliE [Bryobacterales bacterium]|nr:flagellar hook-basal body complex protein FliE [Bryobacterales bacterium]MBV9401965.1 flagellar hook-basal body complex protein FliE [Bryobacterales bacterium]